MEHLMDPLTGMMKALKMPDVTPALKQTVIDGVLKEAGGHFVEQLAQDENDVLRGLLRFVQKPPKPFPHHAAETQHMSTTVNGRLLSSTWRRSSIVGKSRWFRSENDR
jgi:hypothetical protein